MLFTSNECVNIIQSLVISSMRNETGLNLGWVFCWFFGWVYPKKLAGCFWYLSGFLNPDPCVLCVGVLLVNKVEIVI